MKYSWQDIEEFINLLPTDHDYHSDNYGRIIVEHNELRDNLVTWLKEQNPEDQTIGAYGD